MVVVFWLLQYVIESNDPTATMRPSATATALASGKLGSMVMIFLAV